MTRHLQEELRQSRPFATLEEEVHLEIQRTAQVAARWIAVALKPLGLSEAQFNVLRILRGAGPEGLPSARIGERMVRHDPDLTRLLDRLEKGGLVEKVRDTRDRRVVIARITRAGLRAVAGASEAARAAVGAALGPLGPRRLQTLADLLEAARGGVSPDGPPDSPSAPSSRAARKAVRRPHR